MADDLSSATLLSRLRDDDQDAWRAVYSQYVGRLAALAKTKLNSRILQKEDANDVVQSVFRTFHRRVARTGQIGEIQHSLWALLAAITVRKCSARAEYYAAQKRNISWEVVPSQSTGIWDIFEDRAPSDLEADTLTEIIEQLIRSSAGMEQQVLLLRLEEHSVQEIAPKVKYSERAVQLILKKLEARLRRMLDEAA